MVTHTRNLCSAFNPSKCTHIAVNTHTVNTHPEPGEQSGVRCLAQWSHLSRGIEGGESAGYSLPPPTIPAGPETRTCDLRGYKSDSLTIRYYQCIRMISEDHVTLKTIGLGIENRFRFQNRILKVRNRILVVKLKFRLRLSIPLRFFFLHL